MRLRLMEWRYENIRGVNNLRVNVTRAAGQPYPISLIMMPNGVGKTTTMKLLRAVFDGTAEKEWDAEEVRDLAPAGSTADVGLFEAKLRINETQYIVRLQLNYKLGRALYFTSRVGDAGGLDRGHLLPPSVRRAFSQEFVSRFVFDGELAKQILKSGNEAAEQAILYLYRLERLDALSSAIDRLVVEEQDRKKNSKAKTEQGVAKLRTELEQAGILLQQLRQRRTELEKKKTETAELLSETQQQINERIREQAGRREKAEQLTHDREHARREITQSSKAVLDKIRDPFSLSATLAQRVKVLAENMQRLQLPESLSRQFFIELAEQERCVCGRELHEQEREHIRATASDYLADDKIGAMNQIKDHVSFRDFQLGLDEAVHQLHAHLETRISLDQEWDMLMAEQVQEGDTELGRLQASESALRDELRELGVRLDDLATTNEERHELLTWQQNIPLCQREVERRQDALSTASGTVLLMRRAEKMKGYLNQIKREVLSRLKHRILHETNEKISSVIKTEKIIVERISPHLVLQDKGGGSEGQSLAIAYSYLGSLFGGSNYRLPFIVDSPAGALDLQVRRNVSPILAALFDQLVVFITSGERQGFADHFFDIGSGVQFLTINKLPDQDAQCVEGEEVFRQFQDAEVTV